MLPGTDAGLHTFIVTSAGDIQRRLHLRRQDTEDQAWGINPALDEWRAAGWVMAWSPRKLLAAPSAQRTPRAPDRTLIALALALSLAGVLADRTRFGLAEARALLKRWQTRPSKP